VGEGVWELRPDTTSILETLSCPVRGMDPGQGQAAACRVVLFSGFLAGDVERLPSTCGVPGSIPSTAPVHKIPLLTS
jgi:hypothetical protein